MPLDLLVEVSMPPSLLVEVLILPLALLVEVMLHLALVREILMMPLQEKVDKIFHSNYWIGYIYLAYRIISLMLCRLIIGYILHI